MASPPLTHHEIFTLVGPFTRRGRQVDLAASDRMERRLAFKAVEHAGGAAGAGPLHETLQLDHPAPERFRLARTLTRADGLQAQLVTEGADIADLLARLEGVAPHTQFREGAGFAIAFSHRVDAAAGNALRLVLESAHARAAGLEIALRMPKVKGFPAELMVTPAPGDDIDLPQDLLAVLGWGWSRLTRGERGWACSLKLRGADPAKSRQAEALLEHCAGHLARTLGEAPAHFHQRFVRARWVVAFRRSIPLLACLALVAGAACIPYLNLPQESVFRMLILNSPPLLMLLIFSMREVPKIEIPPLPRRATAAAWRTAAPVPSLSEGA
jgi:hypothetical protein